MAAASLPPTGAPLRIGVDLDGVLADFAMAFRVIERELFGSVPTTDSEHPEDEEEERTDRMTPARSEGMRRRQREAVWQYIRATENFWTRLRPCDPNGVRRLHEQMLRHRWEVVFITQRPATAGDTVQRQTQRWLIQQGFEMPSVLVIGGSRGAAAGALRLNYHVDDSPQNCVDVLSDSSARPILIVRGNDAVKARQARQLGIGVATSISEALDLLEEASTARHLPNALERLVAKVGWR